MSVILIDLDVEWEYMEKYGFFELYKEKLKLAEQIFGIHFESIVFRKSQSNHVHVFLNTVEELSNEQIIKIKFFLNEDHKRLNFEISRFEQFGKLNSFFWLSKTKKKRKS